MSSQVVAVSDSAFKKVDEDSCHAMRGCVVGLMSGNPDSVQGGTTHVLEVECKKHKVVTRATFSAECHAAVSASDLVLLLGLAVHEVNHGPLQPREAVRWRDEGTPILSLSNHLRVAAISLRVAIRADHARPPNGA